MRVGGRSIHSRVAMPRWVVLIFSIALAGAHKVEDVGGGAPEWVVAWASRISSSYGSGPIPAATKLFAVQTAISSAAMVIERTNDFAEIFSGCEMFSQQMRHKGFTGVSYDELRHEHEDFTHS